MRDFDSKVFIRSCINYVIDDYRENHGVLLEKDQVFLVWFSKTLDYAKTLLSTSLPGDGAYYELTYNGIDHQIYMDVYKKQRNITYNVRSMK